MDPSANQAEQLTLARSIIAALDNPDAWAVVEHDDGCYYLERGRDRLGPYSRQDALDDAATRNDDDTITADADRLAELVIAQHEWRAAGGFASAETRQAEILGWLEYTEGRAQQMSADLAVQQTVIQREVPADRRQIAWESRREPHGTLAHINNGLAKIRAGLTGQED